MQERNQYIINNSPLIIALFDGLNGGTRYTIKMQKEMFKNK